jgi:hypothetical protein
MMQNFLNTKNDLLPARVCSCLSSYRGWSFQTRLPVILSLACIIILLCALSCLAADRTGKPLPTRDESKMLFGRVEDAPYGLVKLNGARVFVVGYPDEGVTTDKRGEFKLFAHAQEHEVFQVQAGKDGYETVVKDVRLADQVISQFKRRLLIISLRSNFLKAFENAKQALAEGKSGKAEDWAAAALNFAEKETDSLSRSQHIAESASLAGDLNLKSKSPERAERYYEQALAVACSGGAALRDQRIELRGKLCDLYCQRRDLKKALELFNTWVKSDCCNSAGTETYDADKVLERVVSEAEKLKWPELLISYCTERLKSVIIFRRYPYQEQLANCLIQQKQYAGAVKHLRELMAYEYIGFCDGNSKDPYKVPQETADCERRLQNTAAAEKIETVIAARKHYEASSAGGSDAGRWFAYGFYQIPALHKFEHLINEEASYRRVHNADDAHEALYRQMSYLPDYDTEVQLLVRRGAVFEKIANDLPAAEKWYRQALAVADRHHVIPDGPLTYLSDLLKKTNRADEAQEKYGERLRLLHERGIY